MKTFAALLLSVSLMAVSLTIVAPSAWAHAVLVDSQPHVGGQVAAGTVAVSFRFNSRIDAPRSRLVLIRADRSETALPLLPGAPEDQLLAQIDLPPGRYMLRWQVLAVDGHITRGDVPFTVAP